MANPVIKEIFEPYLKSRYQQAEAVTYGDKLAVIETLIEETKQGRLPISPAQVIKLRPDNVVVQSLREGKNIALDGEAPQPANEPQAKRKRNALLALLLLSLLPLMALAWWLAARQEAQVAAAAVQFVSVTREKPAEPPTTTAVPTLAPLPTATPFPTATVDPSAYEIESEIGEQPVFDRTPIALFIAGQELRVETATYQAEWRPQGVEWWPATHVRKVVALPYSEALINDILARPEVTVQLRSGAVVHYRLEEASRLGVFQIELMRSVEPSLALIFYEEESDERWVLTGPAVQGGPVESMERVIDLNPATTCQLVEGAMECRDSVAGGR